MSEVSLETENLWDEVTQPRKLWSSEGDLSFNKLCSYVVNLISKVLHSLIFSQYKDPSFTFRNLYKPPMICNTLLITPMPTQTQKSQLSHRHGRQCL